MNNIYLLTKLFFKSSYSLKSKRKLNSKLRKIFALLFITFLVYALITSIGKEVTSIYPILKNIGAEEMLISLPLRAINVLLFVYSTISVLSYFYSSEDMDLILPLPVKSYEIISSKFIVTAVTQYIVSLIFLLPLFLVYGSLQHAGIIYYINALVVIILSPVLPLIFNLILIMFLMSFSALAKNKEKFKSLIFGLLMILSFSYRFFRQYLGNMFGNAENLNNVANTYNNWAFTKITNIFYTIRFQIDSLVYSGTLKGYISLIILLVLTIISYLILALVAEKLYLKGAVGVGSVFSKRKVLTQSGLDKESKESSGLKSYFLKEVRMLFRTSAFAYNCIFQNLIIVVFMILSISRGALLVSKIGIGKIIVLDNPITTYVILGSVAIIILVTSLNNIAPTSITREGKNAYVMKYIAIDYKTQVFAKALVAVMFNLIYLLMFIVLTVIIGVNLSIIALISILILLTSTFTSLTGVIIDLRRPKLNWDNETQAIKQNLNPFINLILNVVIGSFMYLLFISSLSPILTFVILFIVYLILTIVVFQYINKNADKLFKEIN